MPPHERAVLRPPFPARRQAFASPSDVRHPRAGGNSPSQNPNVGFFMKLGAIFAAVVPSLMLAAMAFADASPTSNKWRIEMSGQALTTGEILFRVTPRQGEAVDVSVGIRSGRDENNVAKDVRDALAAKLSPDRYTVEVDDGEDILIKKKDGQPDFALELVESNVQNVSIKVEGE
jgi:hypothetical protein